MSNTKSNELYTPAAVLAEMIEGNGRFVRGEARQPRRTPTDFMARAEGQFPKAVVVACADSRVTPEILFDQGIGDLFVVRVAGNVISGAGALVTGSIEFAVGELGVSLIMVLGHSGCGAVKAAIQYADEEEMLPGSINEMVDTIKPAVLVARKRSGDLLDNAISVNVERGIQRLNNMGPVISPKLDAGTLQIVGAVYTLQTGVVTVI